MANDDVALYWAFDNLGKGAPLPSPLVPGATVKVTIFVHFSASYRRHGQVFVRLPKCLVLDTLVTPPIVASTQPKPERPEKNYAIAALSTFNGTATADPTELIKIPFDKTTQPHAPIDNLLVDIPFVLANDPGKAHEYNLIWELNCKVTERVPDDKGNIEIGYFNTDNSTVVKVQAAGWWRTVPMTFVKTKTPEIELAAVELTSADHFHDATGNIWWVKDATQPLTLEVTATTDLSVLPAPVYLRWSKDNTTWMTVSPKGAVNPQDPTKVTFDLQGVTALTDLLTDYVKQDLHFALAAVENTPDTTVPTKSLPMSIQQEDDTAATPATIASFDAAGQLTLTVADPKALFSGVRSLKYATDVAGTALKSAGTSAPFTINTGTVTDFTNGISVQATSNVGNALTTVAAKINAKEFIDVAWPVYANAVKETKLTFNVGVKLKKPNLNLKLPVTKAIVHLPDVMRAKTPADFDKGVQPDQLNTGVTLTGEVTVSGTVGAEIKPASLELPGAHFTDGHVVIDPAGSGKVQAAAPVIDKTPGSLTLAGSHVTRPATGQPWWLKDINDLKLEVLAPAPAPKIPVYLRWSSDGTNWHNVLKEGVLASGKITFDLKDEKGLKDLLVKGARFELNLAYATNPSEAATPVPAKIVTVPIQPEKPGWGLKSAKATCDAQGKLTLTVTEAPDPTFGAASLQYSNDKAGPWHDATKGTLPGTFTVETTHVKDFRKGIFVKATSQGHTDSNIVEAKIDPENFFAVTWPSKGNTAVGSTQSFVVDVKTKNSLLLPVTSATLTVPTGMTATTPGEFAKKLPSELQTAQFSVGGDVTITGNIGTAIGQATLTLTSPHFVSSFTEADKTAWDKVTAKETFSLVYKNPSVTNSDKPFVAGQFKPALKPGEKLSVQYKVDPDNTWFPVDPAKLEVGPDGSFRVYLPQNLIKDKKLPKISLRAKVGEPSTNPNEYVTPQGEAPAIIINNTPPAAVSHAELKKGSDGELIATVTVPVDTDPNNPVNSVVLKIGDKIVESKISHVGGSKERIFTVTFKSPVDYRGPFNPTVYAVNAAGVHGPDKSAMFADMKEAIDVSFQLDGAPAVGNNFKDVTTGTHTLHITIAPRYNLRGYDVTGVFDPQKKQDHKLAMSGPLSIVPSHLAGLESLDLLKWNGYAHPHLLKVNNVASDGNGKPQSLALSIPIAFNAGAGDHSFEIRIAEQGPTNLNASKPAIYPVTFKMKSA